MPADSAGGAQRQAVRSESPCWRRSRGGHHHVTTGRGSSSRRCHRGAGGGRAIMSRCSPPQTRSPRPTCTIIHNGFDFLPLTYSDLVTTPVVTIITRAPPPGLTYRCSDPSGQSASYGVHHGCSCVWPSRRWPRARQPAPAAPAGGRRRGCGDRERVRAPAIS
jgi:hypothetical protein